MRLSAAVDLDQVKAEALAKVDLAFARRLTVSPFSEHYAAKGQHAEYVLAGGHSPLIAAEAEARGLAHNELAKMICSKRDAALDDALAFDLDRQKIKARVRGAADQHAVMAILVEVG